MILIIKHYEKGDLISNQKLEFCIVFCLRFRIPSGKKDFNSRSI